MTRFAEVFARAREHYAYDPSAVTLATSDASGRPSARVVLLKEADDWGFVFYTNRLSRKGEELSVNPRAALCMYWAPIGEQVRVEGDVVLVSEAESDAYFATRPRESQLGAWASRQSTPLVSREALLDKVRDLGARYRGKDVPRPPYWGGYRLIPVRMEFWTNGEFRLHDRIVYVRQGQEPSGAVRWRAERLYP